jgi:phage-related protein
MRTASSRCWPNASRACRSRLIVRAFVQKTQQTPSREIELALSRAKEVLP